MNSIKNKYQTITIYFVLMIALGIVLKWIAPPTEPEGQILSVNSEVDSEAPNQRKTGDLFKPLLAKQRHLVNKEPSIKSPSKSTRKAIFDEGKAAKKTSAIDVSTVRDGLSKNQLIQGKQKEQVATRFDKVDFYGQRLPDSALVWSCARDVKTGLLWETKLFDAGVSDIEHRFSWYDPTKPSPGVKDNGHCFGIDCDTDAYTKEINNLGLCGSTGWRLPSFVELQSLLDRDYANPAINQEVFFNTKGASYWTNSQLAYNPEMAMQIKFFDGTSSPAPVHMSLAVRLVSQ